MFWLACRYDIHQKCVMKRFSFFNRFKNVEVLNNINACYIRFGLLADYRLRASKYMLNNKVGLAKWCYIEKWFRRSPLFREVKLMHKIINFTCAFNDSKNEGETLRTGQQASWCNAY